MRVSYEWLKSMVDVPENPQDLVAEYVRTGTEVEAVEKVGEYVGYGLNHLVFHAPGHDQRRFLELFQRDLEPRLRKLG